MFGLIFVILALTAATSPSHNGKFYNRTILHDKNRIGGGNNLFAVLDINFTNSHTYGNLYTPAETAQWKIDTNAFLLSQYGLNMTNAVAVPIPGIGEVGAYGLAVPGSSAYPGVSITVYPYFDSSTDPEWVTYDSKHPERDDTKAWISIDLGYLALMTGSGTFPGGVNNGTSFSDGNIIGYTFYNHLDSRHPAEWAKSKHSVYREIFAAQDDQVSVQIHTSQGTTEQHIKNTITDHDGNKGFTAGSVFATVQADGTTLEQLRAVLTFSGTGVFPPPPPFPIITTPSPTPHHH